VNNVFSWITSILVIIGALNWGLVGALNWNLVSMLFGSMPWLMNTVYILVGLSGIWEAILLIRKSSE